MMMRWVYLACLWGMSMGSTVWAQAEQGAGPTLADILQSALQQSDDVKMAQSRISQTTEMAKAAASVYWPQINLTLKAGRNATYPSSARTADDPLGESEYTNAALSKLEINQMLFDGFKTPAEIQRQRAMAKGHAQRKHMVERQVMLDTLEAYLTAWRHMQAMQAGIALMEAMQELNRKTGLQASLGATDQTTESFVNARLTGARQELLKSKNAYAEALYRLAFLTQTELNPASFAFAPLVAPVQEGLEQTLNRAARYSPQIQAEHYESKASQADMRKAKATAYPTLSLIADAQDTNDLGGSVGVARSGNMMLQASYKMFDGFASAHERARIQAELEERQLKMNKLQKQIREDISQLWRQTEAKQQEFDLAAKEHADSLKVRRLRQQDVDNGNGDIVRLIEAEEALYATTLHMMDLAQEIAQKRFELAITTGTLADATCLRSPCADVELAEVLPQEVPEEPAVTAPLAAAEALADTSSPTSVLGAPEISSPTTPISATTPADIPASEVSATQPATAVHQE